MTSTSSQVAWLRDTVGVYRTSDRVVHVRGDDARSWLNGQISNDVRTLEGKRAVYAVTLTVKGRVVSDLWAVDDPPGLAIVLPGPTVDAALARFDQHIIMEDVELTADDSFVVVTVQGPSSEQVLATVPEGVRWYACARLGGEGFDCWVPLSRFAEVHDALVTRARELGGGAVDGDGWADAHVALAVPRVTVDFGADTYPQEAGVGERALSFGKGCYTGQEVVYMLHNRGQLARRLVQIALTEGSEPAVGAVVADENGKKLGEITALSREAYEGSRLALAYVKRAEAEPAHRVWVAGSPATVRSIVGTVASRADT